MRIRGAELATEAAKYGLKDRFPTARAFQNRVVEWVHDGQSPVAVLRAPTGAGKTATFHELIETPNLTLVVYPTNALLRQQRERFEEDVNVAVLNSNTLEGRGHERTENLLRFLDRYENDHEVVVTNPDILQAIIQDMYRGDQAMEFFNRFDAVVYDEFHFYDALAASGLLLQIKIIEERLTDPKVLLASATPNDDFVDFVRNRVGIDVQDIEAEYAESGNRFRYPVELVRHEDRRILDQRESVAEELREKIDDIDDYEEPKIVVIFNSVKDSNDFHQYLHDEFPRVYDHAEKDNGFDTNDSAADLDDSVFYILNTTSKGEVGLDYDIRTLYMENPGAAGAFLQRFGRAGRVAEATVHVYGLGQGISEDDIDFPRFEDQIYETIGDFEDSQGRRMSLDLLSDLVGFRAAYALAVREEEYDYFNQELREDFASNIEHYGRWRSFIADIREEGDEVGGLGGKYSSNGNEAKLLEFTEECFETFRGLRGRSLQAEIKYPRGDRLGLTTYDLTTTLRYYEIDRIEDNDVLVLKPREEDSLAVVTARLPKYESEPTKYDDPTYEIEKTLQRKIHRQIDQVELNENFGVNTDLLHRFFNMIHITSAIVPRRITTADYEIQIQDDDRGPPTIDPLRRHV